MGPMTSTSSGPAFPAKLARTRLYEQVAEQITTWIEVNGVVAVRHGDGTVVTRSRTRSIVEAIRAHADRLPEVIDTRDALETKLAALAAARRTDDDLRRIDEALDAMAADIEAGGRGV